MEHNISIRINSESLEYQAEFSPMPLDVVEYILEDILRRLREEDLNGDVEIFNADN